MSDKYVELVMRLIYETDNSEALYKSFNASDTLFITQYEYAELSFTKVCVCCKWTYGRDVYPTSSAEGFNWLIQNF